MELCSGPLTHTEHLETQQALVKQLAKILEFTLQFDELKVNISKGKQKSLILNIEVKPVLVNTDLKKYLQT